MNSTREARKLIIALMATLVLGGVLSVSAEDVKPSKGAAAKSSGEKAGDRKGTFDQHVAACLVLDNQNEIAQSRLAEQRSKNQEVIAFAQMMEKQHQEFLTELQKFAGNQFSDRSSPATSRADQDTGTLTKPVKIGRDQPEPTTKPASTEPQGATPGTRATSEMVGMSPDAMLQIKREIADECLASGSKDLEGKQGKEFDASYIGMQLAAHMHMIDELKVLERHVSAEFKPVLQKGRETAQKHLAHAKQVMRSIEQGPGAEKPIKTSAK